MKKLLINLLCLVICICTFVSPINAEEDTDTINYGNLSKEEIALLNQYMNDNPDFVLDTIPLSITTQTYYLDENGNLTNNMTRGAISPSSMTITIYAGKFYDPTYDKIKLSATATWNSAPFFRNKDVFALAWGDDFAVTYHTCTTYYQSVGWKSGQSSLVSANPNAGIAYSVNVNIAQTLQKVTIQADLQKIDSAGTANVVATYGHSIVILGGISVGFTGGDKPAINFSASLLSSVDTMAKTSYFNY